MVCTFDDDVMTTIISVYLMSFVVKLFYGLEYSLVVLRSFVKYNNMLIGGFMFYSSCELVWYER